RRERALRLPAAARGERSVVRAGGHQPRRGNAPSTSPGCRALLSRKRARAVSRFRLTPAGRSSSVWLAATAFVGVLALGYSALWLADQLEHNALLLADRQSELAARILTTAITRDMRGAQTTVL